MKKEILILITAIILSGIISVLFTLLLIKPNTESVIEIFASTRVQEELASTTSGLIVSACQSKGYIDPRSITKEMVINAYNQIMAEASSTK